MRTPDVDFKQNIARRAPLRLLAGGVVMGGALALGSCGGSSPSGPSGPPAAAVVTGRYHLHVRPAPGCAFPAGVLSFPMEAASAGSYPYPGVEVVLEGAPASLEWELLYVDSTLRGSLGTTGDGVLSRS